MKKLGVVVLLLLISRTARASSTLDIGTNYRLRALSYDKANYGLTGNQNYSLYYSQRAEAHIGGRFSPNLEFMTQLQALGIAGSSATAISNPTINPAGSRYPNTSFSPWLQWAYMKASNMYDEPIDVTIGRQPIVLGDGLILSDDDLGFTGIRVDSRLPWYDLRANLFTFKTAQNVGSNNGATLYGLELTKPVKDARFQASVVTEHDASGSTVFIRPSENASPTSARFLASPFGTQNFNSLFNFTASQITKTFFDARADKRLAEGGFIKAEVAFQTGHVSRDPSLATSSAALMGFSPDVNLSGYAFLISGGLFTRFSKYGPIEIHGLFGIASGDSGGSTDSAFNPTFGHRFDGLERAGYGEYYGATVYDAMPSTSYGASASSPSVSGLPTGVSGIRVIGAGVTTHPTSLLSIGIDYFVYTAQETSTFSPAPSESSLGTELDLGAGFAYTNYLSFRLTYAIFSPGKVYGAFQDNATRVALEAVGRF